MATKQQEDRRYTFCAQCILKINSRILDKFLYFQSGTMKEFAAHIFRHVPFLQVILIILFVIHCPFSVHPCSDFSQFYRFTEHSTLFILVITFYQCLGSGFVDSGSGSRVLMSKNLKKLHEKKKISKTTIFHSLGL